ncbi:MAG: hypothetical protein ACRD21_15840, partial [Vicinamibacteria bacterium]
VSRRFEAKAEERDLATITIRGVRLSTPLQGAIADSLAGGGRFLWFSSGGRLRGEANAFGDRSKFLTEGPVRLLPRGRSFLLIAEKRFT